MIIDNIPYLETNCAHHKGILLQVLKFKKKKLTRKFTHLVTEIKDGESNSGDLIYVRQHIKDKQSINQVVSHLTVLCKNKRKM